MLFFFNKNIFFLCQGKLKNIIEFAYDEQNKVVPTEHTLENLDNIISFLGEKIEIKYFPLDEGKYNFYIYLNRELIYNLDLFAEYEDEYPKDYLLAQILFSHGDEEYPF